MQEDVRGAIPRTDHQEEDSLRFRGQSPKRRRDLDEQSRIALQKPNRHAPRARFSGGRGFRRHLLSRYSVRVEERDGEDRGLRRCGFSQERLRKTGSELIEDYGYMVVTGEEDEGSGESQETGSGRDDN